MIGLQFSSLGPLRLALRLLYEASIGEGGGKRHTGGGLIRGGGQGGREPGTLGGLVEIAGFPSRYDWLDYSFVVAKAFPGRTPSLHLPMARLDLAPKFFRRGIPRALGDSLVSCVMKVAQEGYHHFLNDMYDFSQLKAIEESCAHLTHPDFGGVGPKDAPWLPFTLIQGPPGTGKTHTVRGILNTWHLVSPPPCPLPPYSLLPAPC